MLKSIILKYNLSNLMLRKTHLTMWGVNVLLSLSLSAKIITKYKYFIFLFILFGADIENVWWL